MIGEPSFFDPKYDGLSPEEHIRQHDRDKMLWRQQQELAKANALQQQQLQQEQEKLQAERENAEMIAEATKQAEEDRFKNQLQLEMIRQSNEMKMRYQKLCDDMEIDYNDILEFENWLDNISGEQWDECKKVLAKMDEIVYTDEFKKINSENEQIKNELRLKKENNTDFIEIKKEKGNKIIFRGTSKQLSDAIELKNKHIKQWKYIIIGWFIPIIYIMSMLISTNIKRILLPFLVMLFIEILITIALFRWRTGDKKTVELMKKELESCTNKKIKLEKEVAELESKVAEQTKETDEIFSKRMKELENDKEFQELLKQKDEIYHYINKETTPNKKEFYEFRINHYNKDMEILLKKLEIKLDRIKKEDIISEGTKEDYIQFIEDKLI